ncbi:uncharacterized protein LOC128869844 [Anastrepha ludens]|uniref:uncharacterized protein LOC128869844 n=1 Tax=Anastrepha ludens TaxID=28586 RepID=UPI0023B1926B|nr:uncharacterized protein LOC128869844 [Anastrepha ludens]
MYRQILVDERDADLQRIVWSPTKHEHPSHYRLNTVTYGTSCAPYLAIKVLHTLTSDEKCNFPEATHILLHEFYVDDVLTGADNVADARRRRSELQTLLQAGEFTLYEFEMDEQSNTLGLVWTPKSDCLTFTLKLDYTITTFTKRQLLSDIAKLFDPLGFLAPIIIRGKIFMQKLWLTGLDWNDTLPDDLNAEWVTFRNELKLVPLIQVARWINISNTAYSYELHAFADASIHAYAAVVYLKVVSHTSVNIHLIISKTRVPPLKKVTIPRLELCAAVLAAQLCDKVRATLNLHPISTYCWSHSTTTIWWIRSDPGTLKEFVSNRVSQIYAVTTISNWRYVRTSDNPADCASRGVSMQQLMSHQLWWRGPEWLLRSEASWPQSALQNPDTIIERKSVQSAIAQTTQIDWFILEQYSSLDKLLSVTAWCLRFSLAVRGKQHESSPMCLWPERVSALTFWVKYVQNIVLKKDLLANMKDSAVNKSSILYKLHPILDSEGEPSYHFDHQTGTSTNIARWYASYTSPYSSTILGN